MSYQFQCSDAEGLDPASGKQYKLLPYKGGCGSWDLSDPGKPKFNIGSKLQQSGDSQVQYLATQFPFGDEVSL